MANTNLERELAIEQRHVDAVYRQLKKATQSARKAATASQAIYQSDRMTYVRDEDSTSLFERDAFAFQAAKRLAVLDSEHEGLVFGRLDHLDGRVNHIGRIGVRDDDYLPLVIDWRARAAEPFYRATPAEPMSVIRRRILRCQNDRVIGIEDDLLDAEADHNLAIIGEGALLAALKRARGRHMRDIVATIQSEQDEAIRAPYHGVTIIAGGPGTGKTVVALHRAAYLLYSNRRKFERGGILVVGPGPVFMSYIERVLPSLGEDSVTLNAIGQVSSDATSVVGSRLDLGAAATIKGSLRMVSVLKRSLAEPLVDFEPDEVALRVTIKGNILNLYPAELVRIRREVLSRGRMNLLAEAARKAIVTALREKLPPEHGFDEDWVEAQISEHPAFQMFMRAWWPPLDAETVLHRLADPAFVAKVSADTLTVDEQQCLAQSLTYPDWSVADTALLDELAVRLGPLPPVEAERQEVFLPDGTELSELVTTADVLARPREVDPEDDGHRTYSHVLIDEAQDITPMQWRMLRRRGPQASWTIVGDPAQSSWPTPDETDLAMAELIGRSPHRTFRLSTNYRSPAEVFELAAQVVRKGFPDADLPQAIRSTGIYPQLASAHDLTEAVDRFVSESLDQVVGTVGVICPISMFERVVTQLADHPKSDRLAVVTALESKGLEYDAAIILAPDEIVAEQPGGIRVLYVALTRPTQRLVTVDFVDESGQPQSRWLDEVQLPSGAPPVPED